MAETAAAGPASAATTRPQGPFRYGVYVGTVSRPGATDAITLTFLADDGRACARSADRVSAPGSRTGSTTFAYKIKEAMMDSDGTQTG